MNVIEEPVVFECLDCELIGMLHRPEDIRSRGLLVVVAGGPQYRGGVNRLQVYLSRELSYQGVPVLRFDYRGLGDSEGEFKGFQDIEDDLRAAIDCFRQHVPYVNEFILWGGCDAASAIMINAYKFPEVTGIITGNPWVHSDETSDSVTVKHHYTKRIRDKDFWQKVFRLQYNPFPAFATIARTVISKLREKATQLLHSTSKQVLSDNPDQHFVSRMRSGLAKFQGDLFLLMSGRSLVSKEFDELIDRDPGWQKALKSPRSTFRHDLIDADQTYSSISARAEVLSILSEWLLGNKR